MSSEGITITTTDMATLTPKKTKERQRSLKGEITPLTIVSDSTEGDCENTTPPAASPAEGGAGEYLQGSDLWGVSLALPSHHEPLFTPRTARNLLAAERALPPSHSPTESSQSSDSYPPSSGEEDVEAEDEDEKISEPPYSPFFSPEISKKTVEEEADLIALQQHGPPLMSSLAAPASPSSETEEPEEMSGLLSPNTASSYSGNTRDIEENSEDIESTADIGSTDAIESIGGIESIEDIGSTGDVESSNAIENTEETEGPDAVKSTGDIESSGDLPTTGAIENSEDVETTGDIESTDTIERSGEAECSGGTEPTKDIESTGGTESIDNIQNSGDVGDTKDEHEVDVLPSFQAPLLSPLSTTTCNDVDTDDDDYELDEDDEDEDDDEEVKQGQQNDLCASRAQLHGFETTPLLAVTETEDNANSDIWGMKLLLPHHQEAPPIAVGLDHPDVWAKTMEFLPYHDVRSTAAVSNFFLQEVMPRITALYIYSHKDLHPAQAQRFAFGSIKSVYILSLFRKRRFCHNLDDKPDRRAVYCEDTANKAAPFLAKLNQATLKQVFFGAHLMGIWNRSEKSHNMTWDGRSKWRAYYVDYQSLEKRFRTFRLGRKNLTFSERSLNHHRTLVKSVMWSLYSGALSPDISSVGLVQGWICPSQFKGKCGCWDLMKVIPPRWVKGKKSPWRKQLCLSARQIDETIQKRLFMELIVPNMTRECIDGVKATVLDRHFIELLRTYKRHIINSDVEESLFPQHLVNDFSEVLRRSAKVHSKLSVGDYIELQMLGWEFDPNDLMVILKDETSHSAVSIEEYCLKLESTLDHPGMSLIGEACESFFTFKRRDGEMASYDHLRLAWVPSRPRRRVGTSLWRSVIWRDYSSQSLSRLERHPSARIIPTVSSRLRRHQSSDNMSMSSISDTGETRSSGKVSLGNRSIW